MNVWRDGVSAWRGSIEHIQTKRRRYFTDLVDLVAYLADYTGNVDVDTEPPRPRA